MNKVFVTLLACFGVAHSAAAGELEDAVTAKVIAAYGGDTLVNLRSYEFRRIFLSPATGQSHRPELEDIDTTSFYFLHDLESDRALFESMFQSRGGTFQNATLKTADAAYTLNVMTDTFGEAQNPDPYIFAGGSMRTTDALLALQLSKTDAEEVTHLGKANYLNREHDMLEMPFPSSPPLTLYVDSDTGLISKMTRDNPQVGQLDYVFANTVTDNGITYATSVQFFIAGRPNLISIKNDIRFNLTVPESVFQMPAGYEPEADRIDTTEMTVRRLGRGVLHVGQGAGFSLFVDTPEGIVGVGGYPQLTERLARFREETGNQERLRYQVVTHHHNDHLGGLGEAVTLGAELVIASGDREPIVAALPDDADPDFLVVNQRLSLGDGAVDIYEVSTVHAAQYLLFHVPKEDLIFIADHLNSPFVEGIPTGNHNTASMFKAISELDIDVKEIAISHGARIFTMDDFEASANSEMQTRCEDDRPVCEV